MLNGFTNIFGQLWTKTDEFKVEVNPIYDEPSHDTVEWAMVPALHKAANGTYYVEIASNEPLDGDTDSDVSRAAADDADNYMAFVQAFNAGLYDKNITVDLPEEFADIIDQLKDFEGQKLVGGQSDAPELSQLTMPTSQGDQEFMGFDCTEMDVDAVKALFKQILNAQNQKAPGYWDDYWEELNSIYLFFAEGTELFHFTKVNEPVCAFDEHVNLCTIELQIRAVTSLS